MTHLTQQFLDDFGRFGPIGKTLSMLVRPAFIAPPGKTLVWGDWSNIEARVLPWLAASPGGKAKLAVFEASDHDKTKPDVYVATAAGMLKRDPQEMWDAFLAKEPWAKKGRQSHGKVPELSLVFGGAHGALMKMAVTYHVHVDEDEAKAMVVGWREQNQWAVDFWGKYQENDDGSVRRASGLWGAVNLAIRNPGDIYPAGRVAYVYDRDYMGGTLFCALPCGRLLSYPDIKLRTRRFKDKVTGEQVEKTALWYKKGYGWSALWHGKCAENITQAVAGSVLRETLVRVDEDEVLRHDEALCVGHVHDEVVLEAPDGRDERLKARLKEIMEERPSWRSDLPLTSETTSSWWYTKAEE